MPYEGSLYGVLLFLSAVMFLIPIGFHFSKLSSGSADFLHGFDVFTPRHSYQTVGGLLIKKTKNQ
jgi:hypothetical protein